MTSKDRAEFEAYLRSKRMEPSDWQIANAPKFDTIREATIAALDIVGA